MNRDRLARTPGTGTIGRFTTAVVLALFSTGAQLPACWSITALVPPDGCPGEPVTIQGYGFGAEQAESTVTFDGIVAGEVSDWTDTSITVRVPHGVGPGAAVVTVKGLSAPSPFRASACPLPTVAAQRPRIDADGAGHSHIAFGQGSTLRYLPITEGSFGEPEDVDAFRTGGALDLTVGPSGQPQVVYEIPVANWTVFPFPYARYVRRSAAGWSDPLTLCERTSHLDPVTCQLDRLAVGPDDVPSLAWLTYDVRYASRRVHRVELDGDTWMFDEIARGDLVDSIASVDALTDSSDRVWLAQVRPWMSLSPPYVSETRITLGNPPAYGTVEASPDHSGTFSRPVLAEGTHAIHLVWRRGNEIRASRVDRATGAVAATELVTTLPEGEMPQPVVSADPDGGDAAVTLWLQAGKVMAASFDSESGSWGAPFVVASNAASTPDATTRRQRTEVVWLGAASDLRYTTLP